MYYAYHDGDDELSSAVVVAVAEATGIDPEELPILAETIDPVSLNRLFRREDRSAADVTVVEFVYAGHGVRVCGTGQIRITPLDLAATAP